MLSVDGLYKNSGVLMSELEAQYPGGLKVEFVNVKEQAGALERYGIKVIPAQIFYSPDRKELYRHTGVMRTRDVVAKWVELGYDVAALSRKR